MKLTPRKTPERRLLEMRISVVLLVIIIVVAILLHAPRVIGN